MADIKRPNYFTSQFLVARDLTDEQAYHLGLRRRHQHTMHTSGVADGLDVRLVVGRQVEIGAGSAIDENGREIVLLEPRAYTLVSGGVGDDVYVAISYHEELDPADRYTQTGLDEFTRITERALLQDSVQAPPADGSAIVLARIRLNGRGAIESNASIDPNVRTLSSAAVAPNAITTPHLADGAVTLPKLDRAVQPFAVRGAGAITVGTDDAAKLVTIGETHSARVDNPHATTAAQIDNQGGANRLVAQINAGAAIITRARIQSALASGVVAFEQVPVTTNEIFSDPIDPGFGPGPVAVDFAVDDAPVVGSTAAGDEGYGRMTVLRSEVDVASGRFRIFATRAASFPAGPVKVRWFAARPVIRP
jgi:hypothetical protein